MSKKQNERITKNQLYRLSARLGETETDCIKHIFMVKYATTNQLQRLYFNQNASRLSNIRACNRMTARLKKYGLIDHLERRIGGGKGKGSGATIWSITAAGYALIRLDDLELKATRKRLYEPNILFLEHSLGIGELYVTLKEMEQKNRLELIQVDFESKCWRTYSENNVSRFLKPDLYVHLHINEWEQFFWFEVDNNTENPKRIITKAKQYIKYVNSGVIQREIGVVPFVVWIVPNIKRREQLLRHIHNELPNAEMLFRVIILDELETLIAGDHKKEVDDEQNL